jgi:hypothetical protein
MALAVIFYDDVVRYLNWLIIVVLFIIEVVALVNCLSQRADAFPVVGSLSKNQWTAILLASAIATILCGFTLQLLAFIAITAAAVYMLDVRPALRDAANGSGNW